MQSNNIPNDNKWLNRAIFSWKTDLIVNLSRIFNFNREPHLTPDFAVSKSGRTRLIKLAIGSLLGLGLAFVFSYPFTAHSGIFSKISQILGMTTYAIGEDSRENSQTVALLQASLSTNSSIGGGDIKIVDESALSPEQDEIGPGDEPTSDQISIYVVRSGDTLSQIAKMFGVSVNTIVWANDIVDGKIIPDEQLIILPVTGIRHKVTKDETLASIAKDYHGDLAEIVSFNNLSANEPLKVGTEIIIPEGEASPKGKSNSIVGTSKGSSLISTTGYFIRPISGGKKTQGIHGYNGVDLAAPIGTPIVAAAGGTVLISKGGGGWNGGYGNYIVIKHGNGTQTLYAHLTTTLVSAGDTVSQGQKIGTMGTTGRSTGSHLHFEVRGGKNPF